MHRVLENLHGRPTHEKRRISLQIAAGVTAAVFLVWVSTLGVRLAGSAESEVTAQASSPFVAAVAAAGGVVKDQVSKAASVISGAGSGDVSWSMEEGNGVGAGGNSAQATVLGTTGGLQEAGGR